MKKIISLTLCIAVALSCVAILSGCGMKEQKIADKAYEELIAEPINGDYVILLHYMIYDKYGKVSIMDYLEDEIDVLKENLEYRHNFFDCIENKYYFCLYGGNDDKNGLFKFNHILFGYIDIQTKKTTIIKDFLTEFTADNFYGYTTKQHFIFKYAYAGEKVTYSDSPFKKEKHLIYDFTNDEFIIDNDWRKYYKEAQSPYGGDNSFFYKGVEYNLLKSHRDSTNIIQNSNTKETFEVNFVDIIENCPSIKNIYEICEDNFMIDSKTNDLQLVDFMVFDGELYANTHGDNYILSFSNAPPSFIFKYNFESQEFEYITTSHWNWTVEYIVNNAKS